jgi:hypothetical protein
MRLGLDLSLSSAALRKGGGVTRTLDVAGSELVSNGDFAASITGWTDASTAGGNIAWQSPGYMRGLYSTATSRGRQAAAVVSGKRYAFYVRAAAQTVNGSVSVGTTAGGTDILPSKSVQAALAAKWATGEFTVAVTAANIQLAVAAAGSVDWDDVSLRELIPTQFAAGRWFEDDFARADRAVLGTTPDGLLWRQMEPQNAAHVPVRIESGKLAITQNGSGSSASYPYLDFGDGDVTGIMCDLSFTGAGGSSVATISLEPGGGRVIPTVTGDITQNSVHVVWTDTYVNLDRYVAGTKTTEQIVYSSALVRDGTLYTVGWQIDGTTMTVFLPDGTSVTRDASAFAATMGSIGIVEHFHAAVNAGAVFIEKVRMRLG